jgi:hypothetical protein
MATISKPFSRTFCTNTNDSSLAEISGLVRFLSREVIVQTEEKTSLHVGSPYSVNSLPKDQF